MAVAGLVRFRKHQFSREASAAPGTAVAATRAYPFRGTPDVDLGWTDQDIDAGSLDPVAAPYRGPENITATLTSPALAYNDLPLILSGYFGGNVVGSGTPDVNWVYQPESTTVDPIDTFTYEFGDDVTTDWYQFAGGIVESFEISGPEGLGPVTMSSSWRFANMASSGSTDSPDSPSVPTGSLDVATDDAILYAKDCAIYIASSTAGLGAGQVTDALHSFTLRCSGDIDQKRYLNGDNSFAVDAYARATRVIELECVFAKTSDIVGEGSESDAWMSDSSVDRYVQLKFTSTVDADTATPYSWTFTIPLRYYTRAEGESGGNTTVTLTGHAFFDGTAPVFDSTLVNTLADADLGDLTPA